MGFSYLMSLILRGQWMIAPTNIPQMLDIVSKMIDGRGEDYRNFMKGPDDNVKSVVMTHEGTTMSSGSKGYTDAPAGSIAIIPLKGTMTKEDTWCQDGTQACADAIRQAADSPNIVGVVLQIDSPGGSVDAIAPVAQAIQYLQSKGKSIVANCDLCASAAYYAATYCDEIMADNNISAEFGSIGVMMSFRDMSGYEEKNGVKTHTIYSNLSPDKNKGYMDALQGNYELIQSEALDPLAAKFQAQVKDRRKGLDMSADGIISGKMFFAEDALKNGLIDGIGDLAAACSRVKDINNINSYYKN